MNAAVTLNSNVLPLCSRWTYEIQDLTSLLDIHHSRSRGNRFTSKGTGLGLCHFLISYPEPWPLWMNPVTKAGLLPQQDQPRYVE